MKNNRLLYLMITGILLGIICGWVFGKSMESVGWLGEMFLDSLKMLVVPLIISSMIVGISGLGDIRKVGKTGLITLTFFMATTGIAVGIGLVMVNLLEPGAAVEMTENKIPEHVADKKAIEDASANVRNALKGTDVEEIKKKTQDLVQASMKLGEAIYKSQQNTKPGDASKDAKDEGKKDDNVVDADFEEVKDDKEKSA